MLSEQFRLRLTVEAGNVMAMVRGMLWPANKVVVEALRDTDPGGEVLIVTPHPLSAATATAMRAIDIDVTRPQPTAGHGSWIRSAELTLVPIASHLHSAERAR